MGIVMPIYKSNEETSEIKIEFAHTNVLGIKINFMKFGDPPEEGGGAKEEEEDDGGDEGGGEDSGEDGAFI
jgi:hypothetical protein